MKKLIDWIKYAFNFVRYDIWRITGNEISRTQRIFYNIIKTVYLAIRGYYKNRLGIRAAALTYSISFAIVPLIALISSIAKGFGIETTIEKALQDTFIAQADLIPTVMEYVKKYLDSMSGGLFIGVGLIILVYSVYNLFAQIEIALNNIWQVQKSRSVLKQFTLYFSGLLIFPILLAVSSGLSIYINTILKETFLFQIFTPLMKFFLSTLPYLSSGLLFTLMYLIVPNTKVRFVNALIAGMIAGAVFQIFQNIYVSGQINLTRYNAIYGGFAAIPLLLFWLNISCLIFLIGAEISYVSQNLRNFEYEVDTDNISRRYKRYLTIFVAYVIIKRFESSEPPMTEEHIVNQYKLPIRLLNQILTSLRESGVIAVTETNKGEKAYIPAIDINQITLKTIDMKLDMRGSELFLQYKNEEMDAFWQKILGVQLKTDVIYDETLLKDL
ncbi:MAG: YihY/virulence factor BrkB family protein [Paludibacteraceae bacterium]